MLFSPPTIDELQDIHRTINSYCGIFSHYKGYNLLKKYLDVPVINRYFKFDQWMTKATLRYQYQKKWWYYMKHFY